MKTETNRSTALREQIEGLRHMTVGQLKDKYRDVFGESSRSNHKQFLFRRIAWRVQATADEVLKALRAAPGGRTRTELSGGFSRNKSASEINRALTVLTHHGLVRLETGDVATGRPPERWFAISLPTKETNLTKELIEDGR